MPKDAHDADPAACKIDARSLSHYRGKLPAHLIACSPYLAQFMVCKYARAGRDVMRRYAGNGIFGDIAPVHRPREKCFAHSKGRIVLLGSLDPREATNDFLMSHIGQLAVEPKMP